jgi:ribosomal protein S18 acetylase RimI-like enzyme
VNSDTGSDQPRVAGKADVATVTSILVDAFYDDPLWGWATPDPQARRAQQAWLWGQFVEGALRYPWMWLAAGNVATTLWVPPGGTELTDEQEATYEPRLREALGASADRVLRASAALEAAHPHDEPHFYLSLLATDPAQRGHGYGLGLLAANLATIDAAPGPAMPAYLESSNPDNVRLYQRLGFEVRDVFALPGDGPVVTTMWREPATRAAAGQGAPRRTTAR